VSLAPSPRAVASGSTRRRATGTRKPAVIRVVRVVGATLARALFRLRVKGIHHVPLEGPVLLAGNHSGILDGPLVFFLAPRPATLFTKSEVFVGIWPRPMGWLGLVPVHRGSPDRAALKSGLAELAAGGVVGVFPEGTRGTGALERISDGCAYLALRSGAAVVPIAVTGTSAALPPGRAVPRLRAPVTMTFGAPVHLDVDGDPRARRTVHVAAEQLRIALVEHLRTATRESA
jgi:1-acyl-sn-glycerol-3-phosphate acyltransferase